MENVSLLASTSSYWVSTMLQTTLHSRIKCCCKVTWLSDKASDSEFKDKGDLLKNMATTTYLLQSMFNHEMNEGIKGSKSYSNYQAYLCYWKTWQTLFFE